MTNKVLRFIGTIIATFVFCFLVQLFHVLFFAGAVHFFANITWSSWFSFDFFRGFLLPIGWAVIWLVGAGLVWLVKGNKMLAVLPLIWFVIQTIISFVGLFVNPVEPIIEEIGLGFWYYFGAVITFVEILICFGICVFSMFIYNEDS